MVSGSIGTPCSTGGAAELAKVELVVVLDPPLSSVPPPELPLVDVVDPNPVVDVLELSSPEPLVADEVEVRVSEDDEPLPLPPGPVELEEEELLPPLPPPVPVDVVAGELPPLDSPLPVEVEEDELPIPPEPPELVLDDEEEEPPTPPPLSSKVLELDEVDTGIVTVEELEGGEEVVEIPPGEVAVEEVVLGPGPDQLTVPKVKALIRLPAPQFSWSFPGQTYEHSEAGNTSSTAIAVDSCDPAQHCVENSTPATFNVESKVLAHERHCS
jgi:hypothetical protein